MYDYDRPTYIGCRVVLGVFSGILVQVLYSYVCGMECARGGGFTWNRDALYAT